jgi:hypothetical protein
MATLTSLIAAACDGTPRSAGIAKLFVIPTCDIETYGTIGDHTGTIEEVGVVTTANVPKSGKGFLEIPLQIHKNSLKSETQGENGVGNTKTTLEGLVPGFSNLKVGTLNFLRFVPLIAIAVMPDGESFQLGNDKIPAFLKFNSDTLVTDASDAAGLNVMVDSITTYLQKYDSALTITTL